MARFVRRVEIADKHRASLQIVGPIAEMPDGKLALQAQNQKRQVTSLSLLCYNEGI